ncbi:unnamed protein product [Owenia fusiformis]|uniref:Uncharacterized protein n=1 Tax=Owenia fusiformis TaxID=6347 RepID=A0A8S4Q777_OWEFU|nr:unnamed protein product [Owenia fusiformis]
MSDIEDIEPDAGTNLTDSAEQQTGNGIITRDGRNTYRCKILSSLLILVIMIIVIVIVIVASVRKYGQNEIPPLPTPVASSPFTPSTPSTLNTTKDVDMVDVTTDNIRKKGTNHFMCKKFPHALPTLCNNTNEH